MDKLQVLPIIGISLVLIGLMGPWISFYNCDRSVGECYSITMSPFIFTVEVSDFKNPFVNIIDYQIFYFKNINEILIGVTCLLGGIISLLSIKKNRMKIALFGGCLSLGSIFFFLTLLPIGAFSLPRLSIGWGGLFSSIGVIVILISVIIGLLVNVR
jgi:hypothetical protein